MAILAFLSITPLYNKLSLKNHQVFHLTRMLALGGCSTIESLLFTNVPDHFCQFFIITKQQHQYLKKFN